MTRHTYTTLSTLSLLAILSGCAATPAGSGWVTLIDGDKGLENFTRIGAANWSATGGNIQATLTGKKPAYLISKASYRDFQLRVEFMPSTDANSGVFLRCQNPQEITDENCYEANIFDQRPDPTYGTGAIVKVAKAPEPMPKAGGKWNTYEITAQGSHLILVLNGVQTVDVEDAKLVNGHLALQWAQGNIKFRKLEIKPL